MGGCMSTNGASAEEAVNNRIVEKQIRDTRQKMQKQVKVLLLGSGDSGKSTILKQMKVIHKVGFTAQELEYYRQLVFSNIVFGMRATLEAADEWGLDVADDNEQYLAMFDDGVDEIRDGDPLPRRWLTPLQSLWDDTAVQKARERGNEAALPENLPYFYADLPRLFSPTYIPTEQDIIRTRARTTGITETIFSLKGHDMHMLDVGGQKSERRKWIHCFEDVTTILFLVSLSGYDQCLVEDKDANQMQDAMAIWDSICHSQWFKSTSLILFLNKTDLFEDKVKTSPIKNFFPDYEGTPGEAKDGRDYFKRRFLKLSAKSNRQKDREIYTHFTNATDTELLRVVMAAVEDVTLRQGLKDAALI